MGFIKKRNQDDTVSIISVPMAPPLTGPILKQPPRNDILRVAYIRKMRGIRKKFFILYKDTEECPARLVYYDNERKWRGGFEPKKTFILKNCFNINRYQKHANTIALYTCDEVFYITLDSNDLMEDWLKVLLQLQLGDLYTEDEHCLPKPVFEHIWKVNLVNRGLGGAITVLGNYFLCLTEKALTLLKTSEPLDTCYDLYGNPCFHRDDASTSNLSTASDMTYNSFYSYSFHNSNNEPIEFPFTGIRRCGSLNNFIFFETGRATILGDGELWMEVEDAFLANNISSVIMNTMKNDVNVLIEEAVLKDKNRPYFLTDDKKRKDHHVFRDETNRCFNVLDISQKKTSDDCGTLQQRSRANSESTSSFYLGVLNRLFHSLRKSSSSSSQNNDSAINTSVESGESPPLCFSGLESSITDSIGSSMSVDEPDYVNSMSLEALNMISQFQMQPDAIQVMDNINGPNSNKAYVCMNRNLRQSQSNNYVNIVNNSNRRGSRFLSTEMRPSRTYSLDSKPKLNNNKQSVVTTTNDVFRSRTFSVGSKVSLFNKMLQHYSGSCSSTASVSASPIQSKIFSPYKMEDLIEVDYTAVDKTDSESDPSIKSMINVSEIPFMDTEQHNSSMTELTNMFQYSNSISKLDHDYINVDCLNTQWSQSESKPQHQSLTQKTNPMYMNVNYAISDTQSLNIDPETQARETQRKSNFDNLLSEYMFRNRSGKIVAQNDRADKKSPSTTLSSSITLHNI